MIHQHMEGMKCEAFGIGTNDWSVGTCSSLMKIYLNWGVCQATLEGTSDLILIVVKSEGDVCKIDIYHIVLGKGLSAQGTGYGMRSRMCSL